MSMDSVFLNLVRGNRLSTFLGLAMDGETSYRFGKDYSYVEIPLGEIMDLDTEKLLRKNGSIKKNTTVTLMAACTIDPRAYKVIVTTNPKLQLLATGAPPMSLVESEGGGLLRPGCTVVTRRDCNVADLAGDWLVRLYLLA